MLMKKFTLFLMLQALFVTLIFAQEVTTVDYSIKRSTGTFTRNNNGTDTNGSDTSWNYKWTFTITNDCPATLTLAETGNRKNNISSSSDDNIIIASGDATAGATYTLTVNSPYKIKSYSFSIIAASSANTITATTGTSTAVTTSTSESKTFEVTGVDATTASFTVTGTNNNQTCTNFVVKIYDESAITLTDNEKQAALAILNDIPCTVGYPTETARNTYTSSVQNAQSQSDITNAQTTFYSAEVNMPVDGKAYTFTNVQKDCTKYYMKYSESGVTFTSEETSKTTFICRDLGEGKYAFVNNAGKYLIFCGIDGYNDNKGYIDAYDASTYWSDITIEKMNATSTSVYADSQADVVGFMTLKGLRNRNNGESAYFVIKADGTYDAATAPFYRATTDGSNVTAISSAMLIEDAEYANTPELKDASSSNLISGFGEKSGLATFSAPFPTVLPEGVTAYYATSTGGNTVSLTQYEDAALPANEGFILVGDTGIITMKPAAGETASDISTTNIFEHSAGADKTLAAGCYILAGGNQGAGFYACNAGTLAMNKAYLPATNTANLSVEIHFPGTTGIDDVSVDGTDDNAVYDLSGRRVENPVRGIYIKGGKKIFVK